MGGCTAPAGVRRADREELDTQVHRRTLYLFLSDKCIYMIKWESEGFFGWSMRGMNVIYNPSMNVGVRERRQSCWKVLWFPRTGFCFTVVDPVKIYEIKLFKKDIYIPSKIFDLRYIQYVLVPKGRRLRVFDQCSFVNSLSWRSKVALICSLEILKCTIS